MCERRNPSCSEELGADKVASLMRSQVPLAGAVGVLLGSYIYKGIATQPGDQPTRTQTDTDEVYGESPDERLLGSSEVLRDSHEEASTVELWQDGMKDRGRQGADLAVGEYGLRRLGGGYQCPQLRSRCGDLYVDDLLISAEPIP